MVLVPGTNGGAGGVLANISKIRRPTIVDDRHAAHLDPLSAAPWRNRFFQTVVPFLRRIAR
jgi:hypothetical protein